MTQDLAASPFLVGVLGSVDCPPLLMTAFPSMGGSALGAAALAAARTSIAVLGLEEAGPAGAGGAVRIHPSLYVQCVLYNLLHAHAVCK